MFNSYHFASLWQRTKESASEWRLQFYPFRYAEAYAAEVYTDGTDLQASRICCFVRISRIRNAARLLFTRRAPILSLRTDLRNAAG